MRAPMMASALMIAAAAPAWADSPPPPFLSERPFLEIIEKARLPCGVATRHVPATGAEAEAYAKLGLEPFVVECIIGKRYLVGRPKLDLSGKPLTASPPMVKEIPAERDKSGQGEIRQIPTLAEPGPRLSGRCGFRHETVVGTARQHEDALAREVIAEFQPAMSKSEYLAFARGLFKKERYSAEG